MIFPISPASFLSPACLNHISDLEDHLCCLEELQGAIACLSASRGHHQVLEFSYNCLWEADLTPTCIAHVYYYLSPELNFQSGNLIVKPLHLAKALGT